MHTDHFRIAASSRHDFGWYKLWFNHCGLIPSGPLTERQVYSSTCIAELIFQSECIVKCLQRKIWFCSLIQIAMETLTNCAHRFYKLYLDTQSSNLYLLKFLSVLVMLRFS